MRSELCVLTGVTQETSHGLCFVICTVSMIIAGLYGVTGSTGLRNIRRWLPPT